MKVQASILSLRKRVVRSRAPPAEVKKASARTLARASHRDSRCSRDTLQAVELAFCDIELSHEEHALRKMRDDLSSPVDCFERDDGIVVQKLGCVPDVFVNGTTEDAEAT